MLNTGNILQQGKLVCAQRMSANLCYQVKDVVQCYAANSFVIAITLIDIFVASTNAQRRKIISNFVLDIAPVM